VTVLAVSTIFTLLIDLPVQAVRAAFHHKAESKHKNQHHIRRSRNWDGNNGAYEAYLSRHYHRPDFRINIKSDIRLSAKNIKRIYQDSVHQDRVQTCLPIVNNILISMKNRFLRERK